MWLCTVYKFVLTRRSSSKAHVFRVQHTRRSIGFYHTPTVFNATKLVIHHVPSMPRPPFRSSAPSSNAFNSIWRLSDCHRRHRQQLTHDPLCIFFSADRHRLIPQHDRILSKANVIELFSSYPIYTKIYCHHHYYCIQRYTGGVLVYIIIIIKFTSRESWYYIMSSWSCNFILILFRY